MQHFEYKVVPAPKRGEKARGLKSTEDRFAFALTQMMNAMGAEGWDYVRADTLPCDERSGLTGTKTTFQNMLVFRRAIALNAESPVASDFDPAPNAQSLRVPLDSTAPAIRLGSAQTATGAARPVGPASHTVAAE